MKTGYHYAVRCSDCGETIRIPVQTLEKITQLPADPSTGKEIAALVCNSCKHARTQDCSKMTAVSAPLGPLETLSHFEGWIVTGWLQCEEQTCGTRLALVMKENSTMPLEELKWHVSCPSCDRPIPRPETKQETRSDSCAILYNGFARHNTYCPDRLSGLFYFEIRTLYHNQNVPSMPSSRNAPGMPDSRSKW
jgi:hypothetical protein